MKGLGKITRKYLGQSFDDCNCLTLLYNICSDLGAVVPDNYKGYDLNSYMAYWEEKPKEAIQDMIELFKTIGKEVNIKFLLPSDIVIVKHKDSKFPGVYTGNNNIIVATREKGVMVLPVGNKFQIIIARRLI